MFRGLGVRHSVEVAFERIHVLGPESPERGEPIIQFLQRLWAQAIETPLRIHGGLDEARLAEHAQVLGDSGLRHAQLPLDVANGLLRRDEQTEDGAPVGLRNDFENRFHASLYTSYGIYVSRHIRARNIFVIELPQARARMCVLRLDQRARQACSFADMGTRIRTNNLLAPVQPD